MPPALGCVPDPPRQRAEDAERCAYRWRGRSYPSVLRPIYRVIDQGGDPTCVGRAYQSAVEGRTRRPMDGLAIWRDARRRGGHEGMTGTYLWTAADSLVHRGVEAERPGRTAADYVEWDRVDLDAELEADDHRIKDWERYRIWETNADDRADAIHAALQNQDDVLIGAEVGPALDRYQGGILDSFGEGLGGHAMRVVGAGRAAPLAELLALALDDDRIQRELEPYADRFVLAVKNSWGLRFGYHGIVIISPSAVVGVHDIHVLRRD